MKKSFLTMLMTTVLLLLLTTAVMAEADPSFRFSLQIDGKAEKSAAAGDTVTVVFSMERTDSTSPCTLYAIQNEIRYDSTFFELVPDSFLVQDGIQTNDFPAGAQDREIYMNWLSLTGGAHWKARTIVGSFQMRVIGTSGAGSLRNMNCSVSRPDGSGSYPLAAEDVIVVVSEDCTVTFSPGEGMAVSSQTVKRQSKAVQPANPIRPGYTFTGWYADADCTQRWDFADAVLWNLHLYAGWENIDRSSAALPFTDVHTGDWFYDGVWYAYANGLMNGVSDTAFAPYSSTSRAMIVTILWRMEGSPAVDSRMRFADVPAGQWYTEAIRWASSNGIVNGYSDTAFGPDDAITREQLAAILWRYAKAGGHDASHTADLSGYSDAAQISSWASEAMQWACKTGILGDGDKVLAPQKIAERSLAAVWLMRFCGLYA